jgi:hypothetical protein
MPNQPEPKTVTHARPKSGQTIVEERCYLVCTECGYVIDMTLCSYDCPSDGDDVRVRNTYIKAYYKVTEEFLRDEVITNA